MTRIREALAGPTGALDRFEAEVLLAAVLDRPRSFLFAWPDRELTPDQERRFAGWRERRLAGEPIAYILGHREFWSLDLRVTPAVLIPRPETELLVELALAAFPKDSAIQAADLGTGSGAIAAALGHERPRWRLIACDASEAALAVAEENFRRLGLANLECRLGEWYEALPPGLRLDLIVSNPPYVRDDDPHLTAGDLPREPRTALAAGVDGLDDLRLIARGAPRHLAPGGLLLLEHGFDQGAAVRGLLEDAGLHQVQTERDLAGLERATWGRLAR